VTKEFHHKIDASLQFLSLGSELISWELEQSQTALSWLWLRFQIRLRGIFRALWWMAGLRTNVGSYSSLSFLLQVVCADDKVLPSLKTWKLVSGPGYKLDATGREIQGCRQNWGNGLAPFGPRHFEVRNFVLDGCGDCSKNGERRLDWLSEKKSQKTARTVALMKLNLKGWIKGAKALSVWLERSIIMWSESKIFLRSGRSKEEGGRFCGSERGVTFPTQPTFWAYRSFLFHHHRRKVESFNGRGFSKWSYWMCFTILFEVSSCFERSIGLSS